MERRERTLNFKQLRTALFLPCLAVFALVVMPVTVQAQDQDSAAEVGKKLADPTSNIWGLFTEVDYSLSEGDLSDGKYRSGQAVIFQPIMPIPLTDNWKLLTRPTVPVIVQQDVPTGFSCQHFDCVRHGPDGFGLDLGKTFNLDNQSGLGDAYVPMMVSPNPKPGQKVGWGLGPTLLFPTATDDDLGTDTWEAGLAGVLTYKTENSISFIFPQYWWSYSEKSGAEETSHGTLLYGIFYNLPNAWQIGFSPSITYNDKADSDNAWNVPIGVMGAKTVKFGNLPVKFQFGVEKSVVRQDHFGKDWMFRFNIIPVIPGLFQKPLF